MRSSSVAQVRAAADLPEFKGPESLSVKVATHIRDAILAGRLAQGAALREVDIAKSFGISRAPLREAFRILEGEGLIEIVPRKGGFVMRTSPEELQELHEVRGLIEGYGARLAASRCSAADVRLMHELMKRMSETKKRNEYWTYQALTLQFHDIFMKAGGNHKLFGLYEHTRRAMLRIQALAPVVHRVTEESILEHGRILAAIEKGDPDGAEEAARGHIAGVFARAGGRHAAGAGTTAR